MPYSSAIFLFYSVCLVIGIVVVHTTCTNHDACPQDSFCLIPSIPVGMPGAECHACWKCCIFPTWYGECPLQCGCNVGQNCTSLSSCATGLVCRQNSCHRPRLAKLKPSFYYATVVNDNALSNTFPARCPGYGLLLYNSNNNNNNVSLNQHPNLTEELCPCIYSNDANRPYKCPAGCKCTRVNETYIRDIDRVWNPQLVAMMAYCQACSSGEYCPQGTIMHNTQNICPQGFNCQDPSDPKQCPPGKFCGTGNIAQPCDVPDLLLVPSAPVPSLTPAWKAVVQGNLPIHGNYCPERSVGPQMLCPAGSFCPNSSTILECPAGFFCQLGVSEPRRCALLSRCPRGSVSPSFDYGCLIFVICVIVLVACGRFFTTIAALKTLFTSKPTETGEVLTDVDHLYAAYIEANVESTVAATNFYNRRRHNNSNNVETLDDENVFTADIQAHVSSRRLTGISVTCMFARKNNRSLPWLCPISCTFQPCALNAIMGPSGCGKSTLLALFRGQFPRAQVHGKVELTTPDSRTTLILEDLERARGLGAIDVFKGMRAYVPQDDVLCPDLTVRENMRASYLLHATRQPHLSRTRCDDVVNYFMSILGLAEIKDKIVGSVETRGISGGQRKRTSIGMAVVVLPSLLLMDEPTSGLDSTASYKLLDILSGLSRRDITCIVVIHQPRHSSFMLIDNVVLLSKHGTVFYGSPSMAFVYFQRGLAYELGADSENPADTIMDIISVHQDDLVNVWKSGAYKWVQQCSNWYPDLHDLMRAPVQYEQWREGDCSITRNLKALGRSLNLDQVSPFTATHLQQFMTALGIMSPGNNNDTDAFILRVQTRIMRTLTRNNNIDCGGNNNRIKLTFDHILNVFLHIYDTAVLQGRYDSLRKRLNLFRYDAYLPSSSTSMTTALSSPTTIMLSTVLALRFIDRLGERSSVLFKNTEEQQQWPLEEDIMLCCLRARNHVSFFNNQQQQQQQQLTTTITTDQSSKKCPSGANIETYCAQMAVLCARRMLSIWRSPWEIQIIIPMCASLIVGSIQGSDWDVHDYPRNIAMSMACLGVLSIVTHIRTFSLDKVIMTRDMDSSVSVLTYVLSYFVTDMTWLVVMPLAYGVPYYLLTHFSSDFGVFFGMCVAVCWWTSGVAYIISTLPVALHWLNIVAVFVSVIFGAFINGLNPTIRETKNAILYAAMNFSYGRWSIEALLIKTYKIFEYDKPNIIWATYHTLGFCGQRDKETTDLLVSVLNNRFKFDCDSYVQTALFSIFALGLGLRILTYTIMILQQSILVERILWRAITNIIR